MLSMMEAKMTKRKTIFCQSKIFRTKSVSNKMSENLHSRMSIQ